MRYDRGKNMETSRRDALEKLASNTITITPDGGAILVALLLIAEEIRLLRVTLQDAIERF
jgi:hypothetical protein